MSVALCETKSEFRNMDNMFDGVTEQVSICKENGGTGTGIGFGEFLLYEGRIDVHDLESALHYQKKEKYIRIGEVLVLSGAISRKDMESELKCFHELV
ncbi:MAG: hypothetical protein ACC651_10870 [Candidatus Scalindua sp.]